MIGDKYVVGIDVANEGGDKSMRCTAQVPGWLRLLLRRWGLDKSTWEWKIKKIEEI